MFKVYDFHFGTKEHIQQNPEDFLVFAKRMLPRWINGIPDSECISIYRTLEGMDKKDPVLIDKHDSHLKKNKVGEPNKW